MFSEVLGSGGASTTPALLNLAPDRNLQPGLVCLAVDKHRRLYSQHVTSRIHSNSLKTKVGRHGYPSRNREDNFPSFGPLRGENSIPLFSPCLSGVN
jgi:hypothetical protein